MNPFTPLPVDAFMVGMLGMMALAYLAGRVAHLFISLLMLLAVLFISCGYFSVYLLNVQGLTNESERISAHHQAHGYGPDRENRARTILRFSYGKARNGRGKTRGR